MEPSFYHVLFPYGLGVFLAWGVVRPATTMDSASRTRFLTTFIAMVTAGFPGFALAVGDGPASVRELGAAGVLLGILAASRWVPWLLPVVWLGHGVWDVVFLTHLVDSPKPEWLCAVCVPFDWAVGAWAAVQLLGRAPGPAAPDAVRREPPGDPTG